MPRGGRKKKVQKEEVEVDTEGAQKILHSLIEKAQKLTDKDIWNHSLGGKPVKNKKSKHRATEEEEDEELMHETELETDYIRLEVQPSLIKNGKLRDYQLTGLNWMINLRATGLNGILADEMGLGKTLQTIALVAYLREAEQINGPHLVIVPKSTIPNWCREFKRWCPVFNVHSFVGDKQERRKIATNIIAKRQFDVIVCSYEICMIEKAVLRKVDWNYIIVDEAHRLKNDSSKFATILRTFGSEHRMLITGTPLQNNLRELWALLNFLLPQLFDSADDFEQLFSFARTEEDQEQIFSSLRFLLQPFLLRRLKVEAEKDLPPKTETILFVGMSELQHDVYKKILMREMDTVAEGSGAPKTRLLNIVMQLRKCSNHPYLFDGVEDMSLDPFGDHLANNAGKLALMDKLLPKLKAQNSRVLIFSQMTRVLDIIEDYCHCRKYKYARIDGSTPGEERQEQMDMFNAPNSEFFLFLLTTRAGGLGINLQTADIVIIYDSDWNPQMDLQAMDRAHRIGQTKPVKVYRLVTEGTVEERILERAELKLRLDAMVIQKNRASASAASKNSKSGDLLSMVQYGASNIFKTKGSTITDDDIESILTSGETKTNALKDQWEDTCKRDFKDLAQGFNCREFEGVDYRDAVKQQDEERTGLLQLMQQSLGTGSRRNATKLGARNRKIDYNVERYYREKIYGITAKNANVHNPNSLTRPKPLPQIRYWQFYNSESLWQLYNQEWKFFNDYRASTKYDCETMSALTEEESKTKEQLLTEGFGDVSYRDFGAFVRACIDHGKDNLEAICNAVEELEDDRIADYHKTFFDKGSTVEELQPFLDRIQDAETRREARALREEQRLQKQVEREQKREQWLAKKEEMAERRRAKAEEKCEKEANQALTYRLAMTDRMIKWKQSIGNGDDDLYKALQLPDAGHAKYGYTKSLDRFLFINAYELGYDNWPLLKQRVINHPSFQLDFFARIQSIAQLKYRVDQLIRACISSQSKKIKKNVSGRVSMNGSRDNSVGSAAPSAALSVDGTAAMGPPPRKRRRINDKSLSTSASAK